MAQVSTLNQELRPEGVRCRPRSFADARLVVQSALDQPRRVVAPRRRHGQRLDQRTEATGTKVYAMASKAVAHDVGKRGVCRQAIEEVRPQGLFRGRIERSPRHDLRQFGAVQRNEVGRDMGSCTLDHPAGGIAHCTVRILQERHRSPRGWQRRVVSQ